MVLRRRLLYFKRMAERQVRIDALLHSVVNRKETVAHVHSEVSEMDKTEPNSMVLKPREKKRRCCQVRGAAV